ncbi:leucyl/phenylalanyl-tRNA--protein transferase [Saccharobesus litoralis]|uniref:Leucyl/phenylalanyl-tRNA--protein transferase n=1 Tax=Saccharobesus litoralis TaxID=2172099 RepID=A0A2S0VTV7_9ALTE|nr:leucyl/phenylalanyl-tRNA--protein transferase [Saccharobesus litoralis]AWB67612.1 leucyl/phenylalanyl-tRNA--protein transferase [Saccharobesus litoralis]
MTTAVYQLDPERIEFPPATHALSHPNGLLAIGGDLSIPRLIQAYNNGIFPWYNPGEPILWWSPDPRAILELDEFHLSRSLKKSLRTKGFTYSVNLAFSEVIAQCANIRAKHERTWITEDIYQSYNQLHAQGIAHSVEVWQNNILVGGLYGINVGKIFCGESMFHTQTDASKCAMAILVQILREHDYQFIDCQLQNDHLKSLGVKEIKREHFLSQLNCYKQMSTDSACWQPRSIDYLME